jgi:hypothetical protein
MASFLSIARSARRQSRNIANLLRGMPVTYPPLGSATLDRDDVHLARQWLKDRSRWDDAGEVLRYEQEFAAWNGSDYAIDFYCSVFLLCKIDRADLNVQAFL